MLPYAEFSPRFLARLIDSIVLSPLLLGWGGIFGWAATQIPNFPKGSNPSEREVMAFFATLMPMIAAAALWILVSVAANWLYHALLESSERQGTVGKRIMGLVVTNIEGMRISFGRASVRWICATLITSQSMLIGYIMVAFTQRKQTLHDMLAETLVLSTKQPAASNRTDTRAA